MSDSLNRAFRTLTAGLASAAIFALGPIVNVCRAGEARGCAAAFGDFPEAFFTLAVVAVGTAAITLLGNFTEDKTGTTLLGPKK